MPFSICFSAFCLPIQKVRTKTWFLRVMKEYSALQNILSYPCPPSPSFLTLCLVFPVASRVFVVKQFGIQRWKAIGKTNLIISKHLKIGRLQPKKLRNMFERIQKMEKSQAIIFDFPFSFRYTVSSEFLQ